MDLSSWINAHCRTFAFLGGVPGVPHIIVPDNAKTTVIKPNYYEPDLNATYQEMAAHYGTVIIPARHRKPRDKNKVETGVQIAERWILAPLRNRVFFSITELNRVIWSILAQVNAKPFQKLEGSRKSFFESMDQPHYWLYLMSI
jgi:transposase